MVMERFTQPILPMERSLQHAFLNNTDATNTTMEQKSEQGFKPSPHLGTYYEHNTFPVKPAMPEAKTFGSYYPSAVWNDDTNNNPGHWKETPSMLQENLKNGPINIWTEKPSAPAWMEKQSIQSPWEQNAWTENPQGNIIQEKPPSGTGRVKFPVAENNRPNTYHGEGKSYTIPRHEGPYKFLPHDQNLPSYDNPVTTDSFAFNKPVEIPKNHQAPTQSFWASLLGYGGAKTQAPVAEPIQKTFFDYNLLEKPVHHSYYGYPKDYGSGLENHELMDGYAANPWKKVIKFLATIIPIGLIISAFTPTVITVSTTNDTQSRYRNDDSKEQNIAQRLTSSLSYFDKLNGDGCEDRVLCELLVSASFSKNAERHIRNLLDNFIKQEDLQNKKDDLLKVFEAVKDENCSPIICGNIKNPT
ncbi:hypothetical protein JTB14_020888 [Gonioctena quinquepunctata]|nr:hypothetical protein JTB14_020888 [Gonioctena quinquepunctata]